MVLFKVVWFSSNSLFVGATNADFPAFGFLVGRGCCDLTFAAQSAVEASLRGDHGLCGVMCDIEKCFSNIARKPIYVLARWIGIPSKVVTAWFTSITTYNERSLHSREKREAWILTVGYLKVIVSPA